jgi:alpha-D-ribose 1-methylphosphonate 5-triphosphate diphosphatase
MNTPTPLVIANARIVTANAEFLGHVHVRDGLIAEVAPGPAEDPGALDWNGDWLLPGLVELHTDNLEKHLAPRPGVIWNAHSAMTVHDAQCAAAGITTVLDSVVIGDMDHGGPRAQTQHTSIAALHQCRKEGLLRVDHYLHLRCEVSAADLLEVFHEYTADPVLHLVSVMDHTPGARQWRDMVSYRRYVERNGSFSDDRFAAMMAERKSMQQAYALPNRADVVRACQTRDLPMASHDDTLEQDVAQALAEGILMSEFPTTVAAARAARAGGMAIIMGAPNLVKGGSHSGNVSAAELAQLDLLDILSSDYVPSSLLMAAFMLSHCDGWNMAKAVATVSANPARALSMPDRGRIALGLRADLLRVRLNDAGMPTVHETWVRGQRAW